MDGARFDRLTRSLARGTSRRGLLKGLAAGLLGGLAGNRAMSADARRPTRQDNGSPCASSRECASLRCVDGVCCDTACTGQCEACNVEGTAGTCTSIAGAPWGQRPACTGTDVCQASCGGVDPHVCTHYPGLEIPCKPTACDNGWLIRYGCGGDGTCHPLTESCEPYGCNAEGTGCATGCTSDAECPDAAHCVGGQCRGDLPLGELCDRDTQCQSGFCVDEVCCVERCSTCQVCNLPGNQGFCGPDPNPTTCGDGGLCCEGGCIDPLTDVEHCGGCDRTCPAPTEENARAICAGGFCGIACADGFVGCGGDCCPIAPIPDTPAGAHIAWIMEQFNGGAATLTEEEAALHIAPTGDQSFPSIINNFKEVMAFGPYSVVDVITASDAITTGVTAYSVQGGTVAFRVRLTLAPASLISIVNVLRDDQCLVCQHTSDGTACAYASPE